MTPALRHGDQLLVWFGRFRPRPGQPVVVRLPDRPLSVKRLVSVDSDRCWVEGDNEFGSADSRQFGHLPLTALEGRVLWRLWPRPGHVPPSH